MIKKEFDSFGMIPNEMITNNNIPDNAIAVYAVLRTLCFNLNKCCASFSLNGLLELLSVEIVQSKLVKPINDGINYLIDNKYIELFNVFNKNINFDTKCKSEYKVSFLLEDDSNCITCDGGMTMIPECNLFNLLEYINENKGIKKYQLIRFYLLIARSCSNSNQIWNLSQKYINSYIGISSVTCKSWNNILCELGIIFYNNDYCYVKDRKLKSDATIYFHRNNGVDFNFSEFGKIVTSIAKEKGMCLMDKDSINNKRSESMKKVWANKAKKNNNEDSSSIWGNSLDDCFDGEFAV